SIYPITMARNAEKGERRAEEGRIIIKGATSVKQVDGQYEKVTPVIVVKGNLVPTLELGLMDEHGKISIPEHYLFTRLIQLYRAMKILELIPEINQGTITNAIFASYNHGFPSYGSGASEINSQIGDKRDKIMCMIPFSLDNILSDLISHGVNIDKSEISEEVSAGNISATPAIRSVLRAYEFEKVQLEQEKYGRIIGVEEAIESISNSSEVGSDFAVIFTKYVRPMLAIRHTDLMMDVGETYVIGKLRSDTNIEVTLKLSLSPESFFNDEMLSINFQFNGDSVNFKPARELIKQQRLPSYRKEKKKSFGLFDHLRRKNTEVQSSENEAKPSSNGINTGQHANFELSSTVFGSRIKSKHNSTPSVIAEIDDEHVATQTAQLMLDLKSLIP
ncbi:MAG: hypothetical protein M1504_00795, partial [Candidatus Marsarchaeota archaeon]|nr:hypothetical protein [Candidatus Marsarchaeota archaeon]